MRWLIVLAACSMPSPPAPVGNAAAHGGNAAWQAFEVGPFRTSKCRGRSCWAAGVAEPSWIEPTFANLSFAPFDGKTLAGEVEMWAAPGFDPHDCALEVIWDDGAKRGVRVPAPDRITHAQGTTNVVWAFSTPVGDLPIAHATGFVFCPIDAAHRDPPWGVAFDTIEMVAPGPGAKAEVCRQLRAERSPMIDTDLPGHKTFDLSFACGSLIRLAGRDLVDDCTGAVLLSLDALGADVTAGAPAAGAPPGDEELRAFVGGGGTCGRVGLAAPHRFAAGTRAPFEAFVRAAGPRLVGAWSRDGMIQP